MYTRIITLMIVFLVSYTSTADLVVVTAKTNKLTSISRNDLKLAFLGKLKKWPDGGDKINLVLAKKGETVDELLSTIVDMNSGTFKRHWQKMVFTGKGKPPKRVTGDEAVTEYIDENNDYVGVVNSKSKLPEGLKVIKLTD